MGKSNVEYTIALPGSYANGPTLGHTLNASLLQLVYTLNQLLESSSETEKETRTSIFPIELVAAESITIQSIRLNIGWWLSDNAQGGANFYLIVEDENFECDSNMVVPAIAVDRLNEYKAEYGVYPSVQVKISTWLNRPPSGEDGAEKRSYVYLKLNCVTVQCCVRGGKLTLRPSYDISREHKIPDGFSGVWELIDDQEPDNEYTQIGSAVARSTKGESKEDYTSVVGLRGELSQKRILQIVLARTIRSDHSTMSAGAHEYFTLTAAGESVSYTDSNNTFDDNSGYEWLTVYSVIDQETSFVSAVSSYMEENNALPDMSLSIRTTASVGPQSNKEIYAQTHITQAYVDILYEDTGIGIHRKVGGAVKAATAAYKKANGAWEEITEAEAKSVLNNNNLIRGG